MCQLPPFDPDWLEKPDGELGRLLLGYFIAANAEAAGIDPYKIPHDYAEAIVRRVRELDDDHTSAENAAVLLAVRLAAHGKFESAGKKLRDYLMNGAHNLRSWQLALTELTRRQGSSDGGISSGATRKSSAEKDYAKCRSLADTYLANNYAPRDISSKIMERTGFSRTKVLRALEMHPSGYWEK